MTSRRTFIKVAGGAAATPAIISLTARPSFADAASGGQPIVLDDFTAVQTGPGLTVVTGSMAFGERSVDPGSNPANLYEFGGGTASFTVPALPPGIAVSYPARPDPLVFIDLSGCTTIQVAASPGFQVTFQLSDADGENDQVIVTEAGGFMSVTLTDFDQNDLTQITRLTILARNTGSFTGPLTAQ